jgi:hypothetical protein
MHAGNRPVFADFETKPNQAAIRKLHDQLQTAKAPIQSNSENAITATMPTWLPICRRVPAML